MYPDYERNNYPMSITDEDGPFLVMEAELFYNDELNDEFKKSRARHYYSCASAATALFYCKSLADKDDNPLVCKLGKGGRAVSAGEARERNDALLG